MSNPKHTPGPWKMETGPDWDGANVKDVHGRIVAVCDGCDIPGASGEVSISEAKANAALIAAATELPELLEALKELVRIYERRDPSGYDREKLEAARAAIAKAEESL